MSTVLVCVARRMENSGGRHEHIAYLWWKKYVNGNPTAEGDVASREQMAQYIRANGNDSVFCFDRNSTKTGAWVHAHNNGHINYVQTVADGRKTDNLLSLPEQ